MIALISRLFSRRWKDEETVRHGYGMICGAVGILLNLILSCFKIVLGMLIGSLAIQADGFNNLGDVGSSLVSLGGFVLSGKKPDTEHPFGHGRAEYLSALIIAFLILLMGFELAKSSIESLIAHTPAPVFTLAAFVVLLCSIGVKLYMAFYNTRYGKRYNSSAMLATAKDSLFEIDQSIFCKTHNDDDDGKTAEQLPRGIHDACLTEDHRQADHEECQVADPKFCSLD